MTKRVERLWRARGPDWMQHVRRPLVLRSGHHIRLLRGGKEMFPALIEEIRHAQHDVRLATYIFSTDESAHAVAKALVAAAKRGVRVRVVVDGFGSREALPTLQRWMMDEGVALAVFRPLDHWQGWLQPHNMRRMHFKLAVVDERVAFCGGINLIDDRVDPRLGRARHPRLDFALRLEGPLVAEVADAVRALWTRAWLRADAKQQLLDLAADGRPIHQVQTLLQQMRLPKSLRGQHHQSTGSEAWDQTHTQTMGMSGLRAALVLRDNFSRRRDIERAYLEGFSRAKHTVTLANPYFYPPRVLRKALTDLAQRGVRVRLLLPGLVEFDFARMAAQVVYEDLVRAGVEIYEYRRAWLHAKVAVVDGRWATIGSSNFDPMSLSLNLEANIVLKGDVLAKEIELELDEAISHAKAVTAEKIPSGCWHWIRRQWVLSVTGAYLWLARRRMDAGGGDPPPRRPPKG